MEIELLNLEEFYPINGEQLKAEWARVFNIPNAQWSKIWAQIRVVNSNDLPRTLREFTLNQMPYPVIKYLISIKSTNIPPLEKGVVEDRGIIPPFRTNGIKGDGRKIPFDHGKKY
ncbi:hypothetical protein [Roseivirga sp. UBA838]|uniref:hypothetical protein n=1 Tax=Roseivirga sp. UBA838 TaxID=1947393 RepID=UPI00257F808C|nr:hypothetical protein [Roseivirga sp. UBA838]|tara:strand:- start:14942 stop:15286 length:345 start_codon:yes stop_codon:yes gene_type:complete